MDGWLLMGCDRGLNHKSTGWDWGVYSGLGGLVFAPICPQVLFHFFKDKKKPRNSLNYGAF